MTHVHPLTVTMLDPMFHSDAHPYCNDATCPCYEQVEQKIQQEIALVESATFNHNRLETVLSLIRESGEQIDYTFIRAGGDPCGLITETTFAIGIHHTDDEDCEPVQTVELFLQEARLLQQFLNCPEVAELLKNSL